MATIPQHFERLCACLDLAREMEDREEAAEYLRAVANSIRRTERNRELRLWFLKAALAELGASEEMIASV